MATASFLLVYATSNCGSTQPSVDEEPLLRLVIAIRAKGRQVVPYSVDVDEQAELRRCTAAVALRRKPQVNHPPRQRKCDELSLKHFVSRSGSECCQNQIRNLPCGILLLASDEITVADGELLKEPS
jgi:hypothetical protein